MDNYQQGYDDAIADLPLDQFLCTDERYQRGYEDGMSALKGGEY